MDVHTQSNYQNVPVKHLSMFLTLDMNQRKFHGHVDLKIDNSKNQRYLMLDSKALRIKAAEISSTLQPATLKASEFTLGEAHHVLGQQLKISIGPDTALVRVYYETTEASTGLDWKDGKLTADGFPMVTTQFQAINARTFVPCQDTPAQKITYDAELTLVSEEADPRMRIVMAAMDREALKNRSYRFAMPQPIPTYLIALAAGVFEEVAISERVKVIAEPSLVAKAAAEFSDAENMVASAEQLLGEYPWKRFDIFMMPPSFSYGGMENPTMTFIGPTVVAGDKSLVSVIAHELAHSWSGNLVTNETWDDFWINEGTTMYVERLILEALYSKDLRDLEIVLGQQVLLNDIMSVTKNHGPALTKLHLDLATDFDPDDAVSHIPYEKGFNFWLALEQAYGRKAVVDFLKKMFERHAFGTMNARNLRQLILEHEGFNGAAKVDLDNWLHGEGLPKAGLPHIDSVAIAKADNVIRALQNHENIFDGENLAREFNTQQWSYLLRKARTLLPDTVTRLEKNFRLMSMNDEVRSVFFELAIRSGLFATYKTAIDEYLGKVGRVKYVKPIYEAMKDAQLKSEAKQLFEKHQKKNNHITNGAILRNMEF